MPNMVTIPVKAISHNDVVTNLLLDTNMSRTNRTDRAQTALAAASGLANRASMAGRSNVGRAVAQAVPAIHVDKIDFIANASSAEEDNVENEVGDDDMAARVLACEFPYLWSYILITTDAADPSS
jgi:hypothetical protein